jgi:hypothetical protein
MRENMNLKFCRYIEKQARINNKGYNSPSNAASAFFVELGGILAVCFRYRGHSRGKKLFLKRSRPNFS